MNIYWLLRKVPELAPLKWADRSRVHEACLRRYVFGGDATRKSVCAFLILLIGCPVAFFLFAGWIGRVSGVTIPGWLDGWKVGLVMTAGSMLGYFVFSRLAVAPLRPFYSDYIQNELRPGAV